MKCLVWITEVFFRGYQSRVYGKKKGCENMFETGEYIVYGKNGICQVMGVTTMDMEGIPKDRLYYILRPDGETEGTIFTPVDNKKMVMRRLLTKEEAEELIDEIPDMEVLSIENEKLREEAYKECIRSCQCRELMKMIKTIRFRKRDRLSRGKKITATDEKYLRTAEENLYTEFSMLLDVPKNKMEDYIRRRIKDDIKI